MNLRKKKETIGRSLKRIFNPMIVVITLGTFFGLLGINIPAVLEK